MNPIVRDYHAERSARLVERLVKLRRAPGEETEASLCSGVPARFEDRTVTATIRVVRPDGTPKEQPVGGDTYTAIWWKPKAVRVENPEHSDQYVNTTRIKQIRYQRPDGSEVQLDNRPAFAAFP